MNTYDDFVDHIQKVTDINAAAAVLHWDKEVNMPPAGTRYRSQQLATLSGLGHTKFVDEDFGKLLNNLNNRDDLDEEQSINILRVKEDYDKATTLDEEFVVKRSRAVSKCHEAWMKSRKNNDCSDFIESLTPLVDLKREEAERLGYKDHPYDALLDQYEPGLTTAECDRIFAEIKDKLLPYTEELRSRMPEERPNWLDRKVDKQAQLEYGQNLIEDLGYNTEKGRRDISEHPFTISFSPEDVRITTRVDPHDFSNMLWSTIHEVGHALYEQGLSAEDYGLPIGQAASLGIHESQARMWENQVGRSKWFWKQHFPAFQTFFSPVFDDIELETFMRGINYISPRLIRTESDELHYHLHILIRFEIEKALMEEEIEVKDLPEIWNETYCNYLGLEVPDDKRGILQDIHWAHGSIGYFPTYSLGSLYAAQLFDTATSDKDLYSNLREGNTEVLLQWLDNNVYSIGRTLYPNELCRQITGDTLNLDAFMKYAEEKYKHLF